MGRVKIGVAQGYNIFYNPDAKVFILEDDGGDEVARDDTQAKVEEKAKKLRKASIGLPIEVLHIYSETVVKARVTSFNPDTGEYWVTDEHGGRNKAGRWRGDHYFENNEDNKLIAEQILRTDAAIKQLQDDRRALENKLTRPDRPAVFQPARRARKGQLARLLYTITGRS